MNGKISKLLSQLFSSKGLTHEEEQIVEEYRCSSEELRRLEKTPYRHAAPKEDPEGDTIYQKKAKVMVDDELSDREIDLLLQLAHDEHLKSIDHGLKNSISSLLEKLSMMERNIQIIMYCTVGFAVLTLISLIVSIASISALLSAF